MNMHHVAMLVGQRSIGSVPFGEHALLRLNSELPAEYHLTASQSGNEIAEYIAQLPDTVQAIVSTTRVISPAEAPGFMDDIVAHKAALHTRQQQYDELPIATMAIVTILSLVFAIYYTFYYVFISNQAGDPVTGVVARIAMATMTYVRQFL